MTRKEIENARGKCKKRAQKEIEAVESALDSFTEEEKAVISERFWKDRENCIPYEIIERRTGAYYSARQMRRISTKMITMVGKELGYIDGDT